MRPDIEWVAVFVTPRAVPDVSQAKSLPVPGKKIMGRAAQGVCVEDWGEKSGGQVTCDDL